MWSYLTVHTPDEGFVSLPLQTGDVNCETCTIYKAWIRWSYLYRCFLGYTGEWQPCSQVGLSPVCFPISIGDVVSLFTQELPFWTSQCPGTCCWWASISLESLTPWPVDKLIAVEQLLTRCGQPCPCSSRGTHRTTGSTNIIPLGAWR